MMYGFWYRGRHSREFNITARVVTRPPLAPVRTVEETATYRDGSLDYSGAGGRLFYDDKVLEVELTIITPELKQTNRRVTDIVRWLAGDFGELIFDDMPHTRWIAKPIDVSEVSIELYRIGKTTVQFRCKPFNEFINDSRGIPLGSRIRLGAKIPLGYGRDSIIEAKGGTAEAEYNYIGDAPVRSRLLVDGKIKSVSVTVAGCCISVNNTPKTFDDYGGIIIDCAVWRVIGGKGEEITQYSSGDFPEMLPGVNAVMVQSYADCVLTLQFYPKYLYGSDFDA